MTSYSQSSRIGQRAELDQLRIPFHTASDMPEAAWDGLMIWRSDLDTLMVYSGAEESWQTINPESTDGGNVYLRDTEPEAENVGDIWLDTSNDRQMHVWDGTRWAEIKNDGIDFKVWSAGLWLRKSVVTHNGRSWVAVRDNTKTPGTSDDDWKLLDPVAWDTLPAKPAEFPPTSHGHTVDEIDGLVGVPLAAPTVAPVITVAPFAIGVIRVSITPVDPALVAEYQIAAATTSSVPTNGSATIGTVRGTVFDIGTLGGSPISFTSPTYVRVRAVNAVGAGPWSTVQSATPRTANYTDLADTIRESIESAGTAADEAQSAADQAIEDALAAFLEAQARATPAEVEAVRQLAESAHNAADDAIRTWYQEDEPEDLNDTTDLGDLWYQESTGEAYRWAGSNNGGWLLIRDNAIAQALAAANDAQLAADAAQSAADSKATPAQVTAAENAAKAHANAEIEAAEARAAADASAKATAAANAAQAAAEQASKDYADSVAAGESGDALATAKQYAEDMAEAARIAAETAAALDATSKAEAAEAAAAATAALDATSKADAALAAAKTDATTKASNAQTAAINAAATAADAKVATAKAATLTEAANTAQTKADAARQAAEDAANEYADLVAAGAEEAAILAAQTDASAKAAAAQTAAISAASTAADAKVATAKAATLAEAATDAQAKATAALNAAKTDATNKADAARQAAIDAAALDATAKAEQAEADAAATASADATAKANAAKTAAEQAAKDYADTVSSGASGAALDAAKTYAETKADEARIAAESAAALDATAKAEAAEAAAAATAAADATAKANAAKIAAEAKAKIAQDAADAALARDPSNLWKYPRFIEGTGGGGFSLYTGAEVSPVGGRIVNINTSATMPTWLGNSFPISVGEVFVITAIVKDLESPPGSSLLGRMRLAREPNGNGKTGPGWQEWGIGGTPHSETLLGDGWRKVVWISQIPGESPDTGPLYGIPHFRAENGRVSIMAELVVQRRDQMAFDAAAADATSKADAARTAAINAAALDATAKAEAAEAAAAATAAADATSKANAAKTAAENAAKAYADTVSSGASGDALAAAKTYAETKANEARIAAENAAALDATAKAEQAEADAAATAALDATAKADAAQAAATAVANAAQSTANAAQTAANAAVKTVVTQYAVNSSETTAPTTGWGTATPARTPGTFTWYRTVITYGSGSTSTSNPALLTGNTGAQGSQGIQGPPGSNGQSLYTWIKYADTPTTGMNDLPAGKTYMGVAYNKTTATESSNYADYTWSLIKGADGSQGAQGPAGKGISNTVVNYQTGTSGTTAPNGTWQANPTTTTTGQFLWTRTVTTYTDSSSSTAYAVSAHGATGAQGSTGSTGAAGRGITGTTVTYQVGSSGTTEPSGTWLTSVPATSPGQFLWTRTVTTYSAAPTSVTAFSVSAHGPQGGQGIQGPPGANGQPTYTWIKYGTSSAGAGLSDDPTGKTYIGIAYNKTTQTESTTPGDYTWTLIQGPQGIQGQQGSPAPVVTLTATSQALVSAASGTGATNPTTSVITGTATNTTINTWTYSVNGGSFTTTVPAGASRSGNVVTITGSTMTARTITVRMADAAGIADSMTVAKVLDGAKGDTGSTGAPGTPGSTGAPGAPGADAYTVLLSNEANVFPGSTTAAIAGNTVSTVIAYKGSTRMTANVGTITGQVNGLTTSIASNGTDAPVITITVTTALTALNGVLSIPVTVDGQVFTKTFSWSVTRSGAQGPQGNTGNTGAQGVSVSSVTPYYNLLNAGSSTPAAPSGATPPAPWVALEPAYAAGKELYRTERIVYSNSTTQYTPPSKVSSYTAAADAAALADAAQVAADNAARLDDYVLNPSFDTWPTGQAIPTSWQSLQGPAPVKETSIFRTGPFAVRFNVPAGSNDYFSQVITSFDNPQYVTITFDVYLVSGSMSGSGALVRWKGTTSYDVPVPFDVEAPGAVTGKWYRITKTIKRPTTFAGTFAGIELFAMGGWTGVGTIGAKSIIFDRASLRPASTAEVLAFEAPGDATAKANARGKVIFSSTAPPAADRQPQNLWIDTTPIGSPAAPGNIPKRWTSGTTWVAVTDKAVVDAAAAAAAAHAAANAAQADATTAISTADGKNKTTFSGASTPPATTGRKEGDLHSKIEGNKITKQWTLVGGAWVERVLDGAVLTNVDAGSITTGLLNVALLIEAGAISTDKLAAEVIEVGEVYAEHGYLGDVELNQLLGGKLRATETIGVGDYIVLDAATSTLTVYADVDHTKILVQFGATNILNIPLSTDGISDIGGVVLKSIHSQIAAGAGVTVMSGVADPQTSTPLSTGRKLVANWPAVPSGFRMRGFSWDDVDGCWIRLLVSTASDIAAKCRVEKIHADTGASIGEVTLGNILGSGEDDLNSIIRIGEHYYTAAFDSHSSVNGWFVARFNASNGTFVNVSANSFSNTVGRAAVGRSGSNLAFAHVINDFGARRLRLATIINDTNLTMFYNGDIIDGAPNWDGSINLMSYEEGESGVLFDFTVAGLQRAIGTDTHVHAFKHITWGAVTRETTHDISLNGNVAQGGVAFRPGVGWHSLNTNSTYFGLFSKWRNPGNVKAWVSYTNRSASGHTTLDSPVASIHVPDYMFVGVEVPSPPGGATEQWVYAGLGATLPTDANLKKRPEPVVDGRLTIDPTVAGGVSVPPANTFPEGGVGWIKSQAANGWTGYGDGSLTVRDPLMPNEAANKAYVDSSGPEDTGWVSLSYQSGYSGPNTPGQLQYRKYGKTVYLRGGASGTFGAGTLTRVNSTLLPEDCRPSEPVRVGTFGTGVRGGTVEIRTDGQVHLGAENGVTGMGWVSACTSWLVD